MRFLKLPSQDFDGAGLHHPQLPTEELMISATPSSLRVAHGRPELCLPFLSLSCPCHGSAAEVGTLQLDCSPYLLPALSPGA